METCNITVTETELDFDVALRHATALADERLGENMLL
jgi:hypothetical protein